MKPKLTACAILILVSSVGWAAQGNRNLDFLPPHAHPFGNSYGEWSAAWWQWMFSLPATDHPAFDQSGENCDAGQTGKVWFLAGAFTDEVPETPNVSEVSRDRSVRLNDWS